MGAFAIFSQYPETVTDSEPPFFSGSSACFGYAACGVLRARWPFEWARLQFFRNTPKPLQIQNRRSFLVLAHVSVTQLVGYCERGGRLNGRVCNFFAIPRNRYRFRTAVLFWF